MKNKFLFLFISTIFLVGCASTFSDTFSKDENICLVEPKWVLNPPHQKNVIYGVGIAPENINGIQAQRESAISKAINEIATQLKTKVNSKFISYEEQNNNFSNKSYKHTSIHNVNNLNINAKIVKFCKNPNTGNLYILMRMSK